MQFVSPLLDNDIVDLRDFLLLSAEKLCDLTGMKYGTANRLLDFAQEDEAALLNPSNKRPHTD